MHSKVIHPSHFLIVRREGTTWNFKLGSVFYNPRNIFAPVSLKVPLSVALEEQLRDFGLNPSQVVIALFRINGGKPGYYLADLRHKKYYYCGLNTEGIKTTLQGLGIGQADPME